MPDPEDRAYLLRRARAESEIADQCADPVAAFAHRRMAQEYERRAAALAVAGSTPAQVLSIKV